MTFAISLRSCTERLFFYLDAAWLNEGRCEGALLSANTKDKVAMSLSKL